ncbi:hypothetical protein Unana1_06054 [Umbelopsis nana]
MPTSEVKVGKGSNHPSKPPQKKDPEIAMRPYFDDSDKKFVQYLYYSTYLNLVTIGVKMRLLSPYVPMLWLAISTFAYFEITNALLALNFAPWMLMGIKVFLVIGCIAFGLAGVLWYVDKMVVSERVERGFANDMGDIEQYYLGWDKEEHTVDGERTVKKVRSSEPNFSNFWVLTINGDVIGCVGMLQNQIPIMDKFIAQRTKRMPPPEVLKTNPEIQNAAWARLSYVLATVDDFVRTWIVRIHNTLTDMYRLVVPVPKPEVYIDAHKKNEATLQRLAIKTEYQDHGLSTILVKRVILWAHSHGIEHLFATTDELQVKMADILSKRHGFQQVSVKKTGFYSRETLWKLDVKKWAEEFSKERAEEQAATGTVATKTTSTS